MKLLYSITLIFLIGTIYFKFHNNFAFPKASQLDNVHLSVLNKEERRNVTQYLANILWNNLDHYRPFFDFDDLLIDLKNLESGEVKPIDPLEYQRQMLFFLDKISTYRAQSNLQVAEAYLNEISLQEGIVEVIPHKVYYKILQSGNGDVVLQHATLKMHLIEKQLTENKEEIIVQDTYASKPMTIVLTDAIPGFSKGVCGAYCKENRKIYIHPDLAFGALGRHGFQNLLIYEVEVLEVNNN